MIIGAMCNSQDNFGNFTVLPSWILGEERGRESVGRRKGRNGVVLKGLG